MEKIRKIPTGLALLVWVFYLAYEAYNFGLGPLVGLEPKGEVASHEEQIKTLKARVQELKQKKKDAEEFAKSVDSKSSEIIVQAKKLAEYRGALADSADVPDILRLLITEARRLDVRVDSVSPGSRTQREFYLEQNVQMAVKGSFVQLLAFMFRLSKTQRIIHVESFNLTPAAPAEEGRTPLLSSRITLKAYQYASSKEDQYQGVKP